MSKIEKLSQKLEHLQRSQEDVMQKLMEAEAEEQFKQFKDRFKYMIVNSEIKKIPANARFSVVFPDGLPVMVDDYGMGACHWSLLEKKEDAKARQLMDNVIWAVRRMKWAVNNAPNELPELREIVLTGGKSRFPNCWQNFPGDVK